MKTLCKFQTVDDVEVFYRESGSPDAPVVLLLHGFPSSSHMFRDLIPELNRSFRVIAPDLPGFGQTIAPSRREFAYTFDHLAHVIDSLITALGHRIQLPNGASRAFPKCWRKRSGRSASG